MFNQIVCQQRAGRTLRAIRGNNQEKALKENYYGQTVITFIVCLYSEKLLRVLLVLYQDFCVTLHIGYDHMKNINIIEHMLGLYPMSEEAIGKITACFKQHMFNPKDVLIQAGKLDRNVYFIEKGITRSYIIHDGKEVTTWFSVEVEATCGSTDLYRSKPGFEFVEALEQTLAYAITIEELNKLYAANIDIANRMCVL